MNTKFMQEALSLAREHSLQEKAGPFGAVIVRNGEIIGRGWNTVTKDSDPTAHAEINAIRDACKKINNFDLSECEIYSTTEPCPMCLASIYWARIKKVYFGNNRKDAAHIGFADDFIYEEFARAKEDRRLPVEGGVLRDSVQRLFAEWSSSDQKKMY